MIHRAFVLALLLAALPAAAQDPPTPTPTPDLLDAPDPQVQRVHEQGIIVRVRSYQDQPGGPAVVDEAGVVISEVRSDGSIQELRLDALRHPRLNLTVNQARLALQLSTAELGQLGVWEFIGMLSRYQIEKQRFRNGTPTPVPPTPTPTPVPPTSTSTPLPLTATPTTTATPTP